MARGGDGGKEPGTWRAGGGVGVAGGVVAAAVVGFGSGKG
jgi:hypothetical protein